MSEFQDFDLYYVNEYPKDFEIIKSTKEKDTILYKGYYYNHKRENKDGSRVFKCREKVSDSCSKK